MLCTTYYVAFATWASFYRFLELLAEMQKPNIPGWFYYFFVYQTIKMQVHAITFLDEKKMYRHFLWDIFILNQ